MISKLSNLINHNRSASKISQVLCSSLHGPKVGKYFWNALTFPSSVPWRGFSKSPTPFPSSSWGERLLLLLGLANSQIIKNGIFYIKQFDGSQGVISAFTFGPSCKIQVHEHKSLHRLISVWGSSIGTLTIHAKSGRYLRYISAIFFGFSAKF